MNRIISLCSLGMLLWLTVNNQLSSADLEKKNYTFTSSTKESLIPKAADVLKLFFPKDSRIIVDKGEPFIKIGETYITHKSPNFESIKSTYLKDLTRALPKTELWHTRLLMIVPDRKTKNQFFILTETFNPNLDCHACSAVLGFGIIHFSGNMLKLTLPHQYSGLIGDYGRFERDNLSLLPLSPEHLGVLIQQTSVHQSVISHGLALYEITEQKLEQIFSGFFEPKSIQGCIDLTTYEEASCIERSIFLTVDIKHLTGKYYDILLYVNELKYQAQNLLVKDFKNNVIRWKREGNHYTTNQDFKSHDFILNPL